MFALFLLRPHSLNAAEGVGSWSKSGSLLVNSLMRKGKKGERWRDWSGDFKHERGSLSNFDRFEVCCWWVQSLHQAILASFGVLGNDVLAKSFHNLWNLQIDEKSSRYGTMQKCRPLLSRISVIPLKTFFSDPFSREAVWRDPKLLLKGKVKKSAARSIFIALDLAHSFLFEV